MFKKVSAILAAAAMLCGLSACYMPDTIFPEQLFETEEDAALKDELSIYTFSFNLGNAEYQLPMHYTVLSSRGWKLLGSEETEGDDAASDLTAPTVAATADETENKIYLPDTVMQPGEYSSYVHADRASEYVALQFYNDSKAPKKVSDCMVTGVRVEIGSDDLPNFSFEDDITLGTPYETIVTTFGKPSYVEDIVSATGEIAAIDDLAFIDDYDPESSDLTRTLYYSVSDHATVAFELGEYEKEDQAAISITMENQYEVEDHYDYTKDLKTRPSVVRIFKDPSLLGKSFSDFAFKYENNLYTLPMPVKTLVDDGWSFVRGAAQRVPPGTTQDGIVMHKGNLAMTILVHNYDMKRAQPPVNCFALSLSADVQGPSVKILMPKGVTLGSDYNDLATAFGKEYKRLAEYQDPENMTDEEKAAADAAFIAQPAGITETYELTEDEGCSIVKTVDEDYVIFSYIMPDDAPSIELPVSITDIKDPNASLLGEHRKHIDVYLSKRNGKIVRIELQNGPEYVVNEVEIVEQQLEAAEKAAKEAKEAEKAAKEAGKSGSNNSSGSSQKKADDASSSTAGTATEAAAAAAAADAVESTVAAAAGMILYSF